MRSPTRPVRRMAMAPSAGSAREQRADLRLGVAVVAQPQRQQHLHRAADHRHQRDHDQREPDQPLLRARPARRAGSCARAPPARSRAAGTSRTRPARRRRPRRPGRWSRCRQRTRPGRRSAGRRSCPAWRRSWRCRSCGRAARAAPTRRARPAPALQVIADARPWANARAEQPDIAGLERDHDGGHRHHQLAGDGTSRGPTRSARWPTGTASTITPKLYADSSAPPPAWTGRSRRRRSAAAAGSAAHSARSSRTISETRAVTLAHRVILLVRLN